ncbi:MAG: hypothetical protein ACE5JS_01670 [Nitrospinota bacterium]
MQKPFVWILLMGLLGGCVVYEPPRGHQGVPPGHGGIPPGHGGIPPGQAKKIWPPPIVVVGVPHYAVVPGTTIFVMLGVEADVFRVGGAHYYFRDGGWYRAKTHKGPWRVIAARHLPRELRGKSPKKLKARIKGRIKRGRWKG